MHPQTLRKYERAGLLTPSRPRGNQRLYSQAEIERLRRIRYLVDDRGVNVAGLELALAITDRLSALGPDATREEFQTTINEVVGLIRDH